MRIARALALAGVDSRRKCELHIQNGAVTLNGEVVYDLGRQVDLEKDELCFRGKPVSFEHYVYYVVHKPKGYVTTAQDPFADHTVYELLPANLVRRAKNTREPKTRVFPVGRLDRDTTGLLLFTNDGDLANRLMHPRYGVGKWYELRLNQAFNPLDIRRLTTGVKLKDGMARAEKIQRLTKRVMRILIREGKKREVRRLFEALGYEVLQLTRIAFGPILIGRMLPGQGRHLSKAEVERLKSAAQNSGQKADN